MYQNRLCSCKSIVPTGFDHRECRTRLYCRQCNIGICEKNTYEVKELDDEKKEIVHKYCEVCYKLIWKYGRQSNIKNANNE